MKHTKALLKAAFGKKKDGLKFLQELMRPGESLPTVFVYSSDGSRASTDFLRWLADVCGTQHVAIISEDQFYDEKGHNDSHFNVFVDDVSDVTDAFLVKVVKTRSPLKRLVVATRRKPKALDYIADPTWMLVEVPPFDLEEARTEVAEVLQKIGELEA